jgi:hypothetical protein
MITNPTGPKGIDEYIEGFPSNVQEMLENPVLSGSWGQV